jgi:prepilin-type processing-associated H-X9-DG protein
MLKMIAGIAVLLGGWAVAQAASEPNSPFVGEKTIFFARVQTDRIDIGSIEKFILDSVGSSATTKPADFAQFQTTLHTQFAEMSRWLKEFKEAGGHEIDVIGQSDTMTRQGGAVVVPLDANANGQQIAALLISGHKGGPSTQPAGSPNPAQAEILPNKAVLFAPNLVRNEFKNITPLPRPEIAAAIAASGDAPQVMVIAPDAALRSQLLRNLPQMIITQPTAPMVNGLQWLVQFGTVPPTPSEHLIIQTNEAATAQQISQLLGMGLAMLQAMPDPQSPEKVQAHAALAKLLAPHVNGDRVEINVDGAQVAELMRALEPSYMEGVRQQERVESMGHMRQIVMAMTMYQNDHKGEWPKSLDDIKTFLHGGADILTNPTDPNRHPAYVYVQPKPPIADPAQEMVLYEAHSQFGGGVNVGFADGHIEFISNSQRFKDLMLQSMQENSPDQ